MHGDVVRDIVEQTHQVAYRYRLWPTQGYEYISESVVNLLGYSAEELYADPTLPAKIVHPNDAARMRQVLDAASGDEVYVDLRWIGADGRTIPTTVRCVVVRDAIGRAVRVDGVAARQVSNQDAEQQQRLALLQARGREPERGETARSARILIVDDNALTRAGLRVVIAEDPSLEIVGEARSGREAIELVRKLHPDLVLMDLRMPDMDGLETTRIIKQSNPMTSVLVLTAFEDGKALLQAVKAGAAGYVLKSSTESSVRLAIWEALRGELPVDRRVVRDVLRRLADEQPPQRSVAAATNDLLSPREREVVQLLARGHTNREIGEALVITTHTVKIHVEHILAKFGASDRTQAAVRAIELGYVAPRNAR